jgi:hypothetical protein
MAKGVYTTPSALSAWLGGEGHFVPGERPRPEVRL